MSDLTRKVRRMVIGLLASSSAVLLLTGCEGDRLRDFIMSRAIFAPAGEGPEPWTVGPEMIDLLRSGGGDSSPGRRDRGRVLRGRAGRRGPSSRHC